MPYYLVRGTNGVIILATYSKALSTQKYLRKPTIKKYEYYEEAEEAALDHLSEIVPYYLPIPDHLEENEMVTRAMLDRKYRGETK